PTPTLTPRLSYTSGAAASSVRGGPAAHIGAPPPRRAGPPDAMAAGDEPSVTRWSFQDFERYYDAGLGICRQPKGDGDDDDDAPPGSGSADAAHGHANGGADLSVFEQFQRLDRNVELRNGAMDVGPPQKSMLPSFESAETCNLAETLLR
uniref:Uncharacterized protein n=1 Tax=Aegilops tauschii subsp. strangulata TaxID=200361 RepID=A0A453FE51_AEGTS